jgi:NADH-quinone oxidoreductase subunit C
MTQAVHDRLKELCPDAIAGTSEFRGELTIIVHASGLLAVCNALKSDPALSMDMAIDITAVDRFRAEQRFEVVYHLYSLKHKRYVRLRVPVDADPPVVDSVTGIWAAANWHERETFDMFGITFKGHPDLRRMYMPEEFEHYPLRKDFPTMGIPDSLPLPRR